MFLVLTVPAHAQAPASVPNPDLNAQLFRPAISAGPLVWVDENSLAADPTFTARLLMHYANDPLRWRYASGNSVALVTDVLQTDLVGGLRLGPARFGVQLPLYVYQSGLAGSGPGLGQLGLDSRLTLLDPSRLPLGFGLGGRLFLPTSTVSTPLGNSTANAELTGTIDLRPGRWELAVNGGWLTAPDLFGSDLRLDYVVARGGLAYALNRGGLTAETAWRAAMMGPTGAPAGEWLVGGWSPLDDHLRMRLAGGTGLTSGMGTPTFRLLAGVDWNPPRPPPDLDLDGLVRDDLCPEQPEDVDGTADTDGCPELDDDQDGVVDAEDACRAVPEDRDHVADGDGCPEPEVPVRVRVVDRAGDLVPLATASIDGQHRTGADLYLELVPGTYHLSAMGDGYEAVDEDVVVQERELAVDLVLPPERIEVDTTLAFSTDSSQLTAPSRAALASVAQTLLDHPEIAVLRIEGHTDARGDALMNLRLSERRAASVRAYLIERGIAPERLVDQGYGESRPLDARAVPDAWGKNRRVELVVDRWAD